MEGNFQLGPWLVRPNLNNASRNGTTCRLTPKAMEVLVCLAEHAGEPVPKEKLIKKIWPETFVGDDALKGLIAEIRRVLEDNAKEPRIIETIAKRGYRLVAPIEWVDAQAGSLSEQLKPEIVRIPAAPNRRLWVSGWAILTSTLLLLLLAGLNVARVRNWLKPKGTPQISSIAVLPLRNLSSDPNQEYLCDGLTDGLITDLSQIGSLKVISHTSTMQYKGTKKSLPEIARELNVDGIIEGTVQRSGDRVRVTTQLIHGPSDRHVWADSYEGNLGDIFALERDVTERIAHQVRSRLATEKQAAPLYSRPVNPKALEPYLQGAYHQDRYGEGTGDEELIETQKSFEQAIAADPSFAPAYIGLAIAHMNRMWPSSQDSDIARKLAERAVELDPASADARGNLGWLKSGAWDWRGAEEDYRRAVALNPNSAAAHADLGGLLDVTGRLDEGWKEHQIAQELDPNNDCLSDALSTRGQLDRAIEIRRMMINRHPDDGFLHFGLYKFYAQKKMYKEAIQEVEKTASLFGFSEVASHINRAFLSSGYRGAMRQFAKELESLAAAKQVIMPVNLAEVYAALGDKDRAFYWLEQAYSHKEIDAASLDVGLGNLNTELMLDPLRSDPRFKDLLRRVGLPE